MNARRRELHDVRFQATTGVNPGLWMDKFLKEQTETKKDAEAVGSKSALLAEVARTLTPDGYTQAFKARMQSLTADRSRIIVADATVLGRMVIGLGAKGPTEVGLHLDHTWGVPVLPGSALKGLAASAAHLLVKKPGWTKAPADGRTGEPSDFDRLFGTTDDQGQVIFHDAWWVPNSDRSPVPLHLDVMTVHHANYYGNKADLPSDADSPIPITFVSTTGTFAVILEGDPEWTEAALLLLEEGLRELGLGAKTNAGYGRMSLERTLSAEEKEAAKRDAGFRTLQDSLVARFLGPQNATDIFKEFAKAEREGCPQATLAEIGSKLLAKNSKCWRDWSGKTDKRSPDELATFAKYFKTA